MFVFSFVFDTANLVHLFECDRVINYDKFCSTSFGILIVYLRYCCSKFCNIREIINGRGYFNLTF